MFNHAQKGRYFLHGEGLSSFHTCVPNGARTVTFLLEATAAAPSPLGPGLAPQPRSPASLMVTCHLLPPATPCFRLFQEDPRFWVQEPFHALTLCWGPQRAHVWARFVSYTHLIRDENQEVKIYLFMNPLKTAGVNKSPESFLGIKSPYFPKQRTRE